MTKRILITGSRDWDNAGLIRDVLLHRQHQYGIIREDVVIVHGGARGADTIAGAIAAELGMKVEVHPADWNLHGKRAGFVRNAEMVAANIDVCIAFIRNESRGATMCADLAEKAGILTLRYTA